MQPASFVEEPFRWIGFRFGHDRCASVIDIINGAFTGTGDNTINNSIRVIGTMFDFDTVIAGLIPAQTDSKRPVVHPPTSTTRKEIRRPIASAQRLSVLMFGFS